MIFQKPLSSLIFVDCTAEWFQFEILVEGSEL